MREKQSILNEMKAKPDSNCRAGSEVEIKRILVTIFNAKKKAILQYFSQFTS